MTEDPDGVQIVWAILKALLVLIVFLWMIGIVK